MGAKEPSASWSSAIKPLVMQRWGERCRTRQLAAPSQERPCRRQSCMLGTQPPADADPLPRGLSAGLPPLMATPDPRAQPAPSVQAWAELPSAAGSAEGGCSQVAGAVGRCREGVLVPKSKGLLERPSPLLPVEPPRVDGVAEQGDAAGAELSVLNEVRPQRLFQNRPCFALPSYTNGFAGHELDFVDSKR